MVQRRLPQTRDNVLASLSKSSIRFVKTENQLDKKKCHDVIIDAMTKLIFIDSKACMHTHNSIVACKALSWCGLRQWPRKKREAKEVPFFIENNLVTSNCWRGRGNYWKWVPRLGS